MVPMGRYGHCALEYLQHLGEGVDQARLRRTDGNLSWDNVLTWLLGTTPAKRQSSTALNRMAPCIFVFNMVTTGLYRPA